MQLQRMSYPNLILLLFDFFLFVSFAASSSSSFNTTKKCSPNQSHALLIFKRSLFSINDSSYRRCQDCLGSGYHPIMRNWNTSIDCCSWDGVTCNPFTGDVIGLDLSCGMLQGTIHSNSTLFHLQSLETLDLFCNNITGDIPSEILLLQKLVFLDLSSNGFNLQPYILNNLLLNSTNMLDLWLAEVNIGGFVLPTYLNISSSLKSLDLSSTGMQGKLPDYIFSNQYLEQLYLSGNINLTGPLPEVNTSTNIPLNWLDLSFTNLSGEIPDSIGHLKSLIYFSLSDCRMIGSLPKSLGNLRNLSFLYLRSNMLSGTLPSSLFSLPLLEYIRLSNNMFSGNIPLELFSCQSMKGISLAHNQLAGQVDVLDHGPSPQTFQRLTNLTYIDLSANNFSGEWELDTLFASLRNLEELHLSRTGLSVTTKNGNHYVNPGFKSLSLAYCKLTVFPESLRKMKKLKNLDMSNGYIHGHIPDWVGEIGVDRLKVLDLSNNSITGTIPDVYDGWEELEGFILNGNQLEGKVPTSLSKCRNLRILDLGNNHLNGTFPSWLGDLPKLQALVLRSNNFRGPIISSSIVGFPFPSLRVLDLSYNGFVGQLPVTYFQNFNAMKNVVKTGTKPEYLFVGRLYYSIIVAVKGVDLDFPQLLVEYTIIDLSNNNFEREIPSIIGNLSSLKVLNLSHNSLTGRIPNALANLSEIESLDLSWNKLTGDIPRALADITTLAVLNLSHNQLVGRIPQGKQFNTFDGNSFGGNYGLCGFPLPKQCERRQVEGDRKDDDEEEENGFTWRVVMLGYGCGTLLGLVMGFLMLYTERPKRFNEIANAAAHMIFKR